MGTIHTFVDTSEQACAAVSYLRHGYNDGDVSVIFVAAKPRFSPLKVITFPRLELVAAVIGVRISKFVGNSLDMLVKEHVFWSDSKNVIYWLRNENRHLKQFVANRIGDIHDSVSLTQWRHVPGKYNPADKATRGLTAKELVNKKEWLFGPSCLHEDPSKWPEQHFADSKEAQEEEKEVQKTCATSAMKPLINVLSFSKWLKLVRTVSRILRFAENICRREADCQIGELEPQELKKTERIIICLAQGECFPDQLKSLRNGRGIPSRI